MRRSAAVFPVLLLASLVALLGVTPAPASAGPAPVAVAVVDVLDLINNYPGFKTAKDALEAAVKVAEGDFDLVKKDVAKLEGDLKLAPINAPNRTAQEKVIAFKKIQGEFDVKWKVRVAQDEYMGKLIRVHGEVKGHIASYARANGIGLVLQMTSEDVSGKTPDELIPNIVVRTVVYFDGALNITDAVKATFTAVAPPR